MQRETKLSRWSARIIEACWLLALTLIPIYFNLFSTRHFEPDKALTLRTLVVIAATMGLIRAIETFRPTTSPTSGPELWKRFSAIPMALPTLVYALVFLLTTVTSVVPGISFWGSYQRLQGTYTNLSYILLFVLILVTLRNRAQIERIISITLIAGVTAASYALLQHFQLDPLPWRGDVITRVASTLGNSIFIGAYLIMVTPLALYRMVTRLSAARTAAPSTNAQADWLRSCAHLLLVLCGILLLLSVLKFGAAVRTVDFRYWWVFPAAVISATTLWWLPTFQPLSNQRRPPVWPGFVTLGFLLLFSAHFVWTQRYGIQAVATIGEAPNAGDWWIWLFLSIGCGSVGYGLTFFVPPRPAQASRLSLAIEAAASAVAVLLMVVATILSQSRGPLLGLGAGVVVFISLLLWAALRHARAQAATTLIKQLRNTLIAWITTSIVAATFLVIFNLSDAPFFNQLRTVPYVGRMGRLLEINSGTGLVRRLIWAGDTYGGGAIALITMDWWHSLVGWGPESMFVAFNPVFPPSLANVEARGASPDRSHMAYLDELVTKGFLGLFSYIFLIVSFITLAIRLMLRSKEWRGQVFAIAMLSTVVCHITEGITGIPIVATLMLLWVTLAITVAEGALTGHYHLGLAAATPPPETSEAVPQRRGGNRTRRGQSAPKPSNHRENRTAAFLTYAILMLVALSFTWSANLAPIYADMRFQEGTGRSEQSQLDLDQLVIVLDDFVSTIRSSPNEDFYYLSLGRTLMSTAGALSLRGVPLGEANPKADIQDLMNLYDQAAIVGFIQRSTPLSMMSYAEVVLLKAHELNPLNKDHFANLGRLNTYWYRISNDPKRLHIALDWYEEVTKLARNDVTLINERAGIVAELGNDAKSRGDQAQATSWYTQAAELLAHSAVLDARYGDTLIRQGDLACDQDDLDAAVAFYEQGIGLDPVAVASNIERMNDCMTGRTDLIAQLRDAFVPAVVQNEAQLAQLSTNPDPNIDTTIVQSNTALLHAVVGILSVYAGEPDRSLSAYQRAITLEPTNFEYSRNYTIMLSETLHYAEARNEANRMLALAQASRDNDVISELQQILAAIEQAE